MRMRLLILSKGLSRVDGTKNLADLGSFATTAKQHSRIRNAMRAALVTAFAIVIPLGACTSVVGGPDTSGQGRTSARSAADLSACNTSGMAAVAGSTQDEKMSAIKTKFDACMAAQGWSRSRPGAPY